MIKSPFIDKLIDSHQYQGHSNDCGPYSISIVLNALNISKISGTSISKSLSGISWKGIIPTFYRFPNGGTFPWSIAKVFREYNLYCKWSVFNTRDEIINQLCNNSIVLLLIGQIYPIWAHYVICVAYSMENGFGFVDPGSSSNNVVWVSEQNFMSYWKTYACSKIIIKDIKFIQ